MNAYLAIKNNQTGFMKNYKRNLRTCLRFLAMALVNLFCCLE